MPEFINLFNQVNLFDHFNLVTIFDPSPTPILAIDAFWLPHLLTGFLSALLLPVIMLVVLIAVLGGETKGIGDAVVDAIGTALVLIFDIALALAKTFFTTAVFLVGALVRAIGTKKSTIRVKVGDGPEYK